MMDIEGLVEAALFISSRPLSEEELTRAIKVRRREVREALKTVKSKWNGAIQIREIGGSYSMQVRDEYAERLRDLAPPQIPKKLLKTLSLVAYHQPVKQVELRDMLGRRAYDDLKQLEGLGMVRRKPLGCTKIVETTKLFNDYFGIDGKEEIRRILEEKRKPSPEPRTSSH